GLTCDAGICTPTAGDGDGDATGDGDGDATGDGDGDATGDGDGDGVVPYGPCPNGDEDCAPGEVCVTGGQQGNNWTICTPGECEGEDDCDATPDDVCADAPGDGVPLDYCLPATCSQQDPCPDGMQCYTGFGPNAQSVCLWPDSSLRQLLREHLRQLDQLERDRLEPTHDPV